MGGPKLEIEAIAEAPSHHLPAARRQRAHLLARGPAHAVAVGHAGGLEHPEGALRGALGPQSCQKGLLVGRKCKRLGVQGPARTIALVERWPLGGAQLQHVSQRVLAVQRGVGSRVATEHMLPHVDSLEDVQLECVSLVPCDISLSTHLPRQDASQQSLASRIFHRPREQLRLCGCRPPIPGAELQEFDQGLLMAVSANQVPIKLDGA
mmetsp:Transcript_30044/g.95932  ORF Transcript_30044/g.95932 Transcript_30044/m.95932 type:complete len:208 (+) Transcript_30044:34-657(+)